MTFVSQSCDLIAEGRTGIAFWHYWHKFGQDLWFSWQQHLQLIFGKFYAPAILNLEGGGGAYSMTAECTSVHTIKLIPLVRLMYQIEEPS